MQGSPGVQVCRAPHHQPVHMPRAPGAQDPGTPPRQELSQTHAGTGTHEACDQVWLLNLLWAQKHQQPRHLLVPFPVQTLHLPRPRLESAAGGDRRHRQPLSVRPRSPGSQGGPPVEEAQARPPRWSVWRPLSWEVWNMMYTSLHTCQLGNASWAVSVILHMGTMLLHLHLRVPRTR